MSYEPWAGPDGTGANCFRIDEVLDFDVLCAQRSDGNGNTDVERIAAVVAYIFTIMIDGAVPGHVGNAHRHERQRGEVNDKLRAIKMM